IVPGSTLMYGSSFIIVTRRPRASRMAASEAAAMPLPSEDTTPPVTKMSGVVEPGEVMAAGWLESGILPAGLRRRDCGDADPEKTTPRDAGRRSAARRAALAYGRRPADTPRGRSDVLFLFFVLVAGLGLLGLRLVRLGLLGRPLLRRFLGL